MACSLTHGHPSMMGVHRSPRQSCPHYSAAVQRARISLRLPGPVRQGTSVAWLRPPPQPRRARMLSRRRAPGHLVISSHVHHVVVCGAWLAFHGACGALFCWLMWAGTRHLTLTRPSPPGGGGAQSARSGTPLGLQNLGHRQTMRGVPVSLWSIHAHNNSCGLGCIDARRGTQVPRLTPARCLPRSLPRPRPGHDRHCLPGSQPDGSGV